MKNLKILILILGVSYSTTTWCMEKHESTKISEELMEMLLNSEARDSVNKFLEIGDNNPINVSVLSTLVFCNRIDILDVIFRDNIDYKEYLTDILSHIIKPVDPYHDISDDRLNAIKLLIKYGADVNHRHRFVANYPLLHVAKNNLRFAISSKKQKSIEFWENVVKVLQDNGAKEKIENEGD